MELEGATRKVDDDLMVHASDTSRPPIVIAEAADAHYGDLERAKAMAAAARGARADVIKFQHHIPEEEMLRDIPISSNMREPLWDFLKRNALSIEQHVELRAYCDEIGITYCCTPFSLAAARELEAQVDPPFYKIGSGEMLDFPTLAGIATFGKQMIVSTGMSTVDEVDETYDFLSSLGNPFALMNCTSAYPPGADDMHLSFIGEMRDRYPRAVIGHSDHTPSHHFSLAAVALGARIIERHVTLDASLPGPDADVSLTFPQLEDFIAQVEDLSIALNTPKRIQEREHEIRRWAHRSLVYLRDLPAGHVISEDDIWGKRPGTGLPARTRGLFIGRRLARAVEADTLLSDADFTDQG